MRVIKLRRPLLTLAVILSAVSAALWALGIFATLSPRWDRADLGAAISTTNLAGLIGAVRLSRDRDKQLLVRGLIEASQRAATEETAPLRQLRSVR